MNALAAGCPSMFTLPTSVAAPLVMHGDCLDLLAGIPDASIDVVITDPPAGVGFMSKTWDSFAGYAPRTAKGVDVDARLRGLLPPWAIGFVAFMTDVWSEVDRVLKPGAFVCAWALPKTADLAGLAMRAVGWEVHDSLLHLFSGMPKNGCVGKKIDKMHGAEREVVGTRCQRANKPSGQSAPFNASSAEVESLTAPSTDEAKRWTDWSSQLAPGHEQWLLARKPTPLTYATQVLTHGCGALNIGACRVSRGGRPARDHSGEAHLGNEVQFSNGRSGLAAGTTDLGSWPKNVVLTEGGEHCPVAMLDEQSGVQRDGVAVKRNLPDEGGKPGITAIHSGTRRTADQTFGSSGGASRFFTRFKYQAKNSDRRAGSLRHHQRPRDAQVGRPHALACPAARCQDRAHRW